MPQRTTRISALILEIVAGRAPYPWRLPHGPVQGPPTRLAPGRRAQLRAGAADAGLEPAGRRPRRPGLPHRAVPARRPGDLERQLVRRPLHPHLQLPLPAAGGAARAAGGRACSPSSPPPTSSTASSATAGGSEARWATLWFAAGVVTLLADGQLTFALGVAFGLAALRCLQIGRGDAGARSPPRPAPSPARSPRAFLAGVVAGRRAGAGPPRQPRRARRRRRSRSA